MAWRGANEFMASITGQNTTNNGNNSCDTGLNAEIQKTFLGRPLDDYYTGHKHY